MKEKRAPSSQSKWGCLGLFVVVFMSCASIWLLGTINPYSEMARIPSKFNVDNMSWDAERETLTFLRRPFDPYVYTLDNVGHLTCVNRQVAFEDEEPDRRLTQDQYRSLEQRYGEIFGLRNFDDTLVLIISYPIQYMGLPFTLPAQGLLLFRDVNDASPILVDAPMLHQAGLECNNSRSFYIFCGGLFIVCATISVMRIRRLRYKYLWLCAFGMLLLISLIFGYALSFFSIDF
jgi:hypothetical protein